MKKYWIILIAGLLLCGFPFPAYAEDENEKADYVCIGSFAEENEPYEYLPDVLENTCIYKLRYITGNSAYRSSKYECNVRADEMYLYVIIEKQYFEKHFNYEDMYSIQLKDAGKTMDIQVDEEGGINTVALLTLYDTEKNDYLICASLADLEITTNYFVGDGYLGEYVSDISFVPELMGDAAIYKFRILSTSSPVTKNYVFVVCSKAYYEARKDQNIGYRLFLEDCGLKYKDQTVWSFMNLETQSYMNIQEYDLDEMKSWVEGPEEQVDTGYNRFLYFIKHASTGTWVIIVVAFLLICEICYVFIKKRKK